MRNLGIILICLFVGVLCVHSAHAEANNEELGYYERMSGMAFFYGAALFEAQDNPEERVAVASDVSFMMFHYWVDTRIRKLKPSVGVDRVVQKVYKVHFETLQEQEIARVFEDPLIWLESETPQKSLPPKVIRHLNKSEYKKLLERYHGFSGVGGRPLSDEDKLRTVLASETQEEIAGYSVTVRPGGSSTTSFSSSDGHAFTVGKTTVAIKKDKLYVNGKSYGALNKGDAILVEAGKILVSRTTERIAE